MPIMETMSQGRSMQRLPMVAPQISWCGWLKTFSSSSLTPRLIKPQPLSLASLSSLGQ
jgi:hypothetical protein